MISKFAKYTHRPWATDELTRASEYYKTHTLLETAKVLNRSPASVRNAFSLAGIKKTREQKRAQSHRSRDRYRIQRDELARMLRQAFLCLKVSDRDGAMRALRAAIVKSEGF